MQNIQTRIQKAFRDFALLEHWSAPHAVTLTLKQGMLVPGDVGALFVPLTKEAVTQNFGHFVTMLSRKVLGTKAKRFGKRLNSISVIEGGRGKRLHIHAVIDCPREDLAGAFPAMIRETWQKTRWGQAQIDVQPDANEGWLNYISKFRDKPDYADAIDWINYHNADC